MTDAEQRQCLAINPFEGDFGAPGDRIFKDRIIRVRRPRTCGCCRLPLVAAEHARVIVALFDGDLMSYSFCERCCLAMARCREDDGREWEARISLGDGQVRQQA